MRGPQSRLCGFKVQDVGSFFFSSEALNGFDVLHSWPWLFLWHRNSLDGVVDNTSSLVGGDAETCSRHKYINNHKHMYS